MILVPLGVGLFLSIHRHYECEERVLADPSPARFGGGGSSNGSSPIPELAVIAPAGPLRDMALRYVDDVENAGVTLLESPDGPGLSHHDIAQQITTLQNTGGPHPVGVVFPYWTDQGREALTRAALMSHRLRHDFMGREVFVVDLPAQHDQVSGLMAPVPPRRATLVIIDRLGVMAVEAARVSGVLGGGDVHAVHFDVERDETERLLDEWGREGLDIELQIVTAPYRSLEDALTNGLSAVRNRGFEFITVVVPHLVPAWWQRPLYGHEAQTLAMALRHQPDAAFTLLPRPVPRCPLSSPGRR